jgi:hypothetical protein
MLIKLGADTYKIEYDYNAMCDIEDLCGMGIQMIALNESRLGLGAIRAFLKAGLAKHHPEISVTQAGELLQGELKAGRNFKNLTNQLMEAMKQSGLIQEPAGNRNNIEKKNHGVKK